MQAEDWLAMSTIILFICVCVLCLAITVQKRTIDELRASRARYRGLLRREKAASRQWKQKLAESQPATQAITITPPRGRRSK